MRVDWKLLKWKEARSKLWWMSMIEMKETALDFVIRDDKRSFFSEREECSRRYKKFKKNLGNENTYVRLYSVKNVKNF